MHRRQRVSDVLSCLGPQLLPWRCGWAQCTFYQAKGEAYAALLLLPEASHPQMSPSRTENGVYKELPFFCTLRESFCFSTPTWGRPRWPAKNKSDQWKLKSNEITSESFVLLKYFQYCCSDDGWLFPFPIYFPSPSLGFITLGNVHGMARKKEMQQVHSPLQCQDNFYLSRFSVGFFVTGLCKASSSNRSGSVLLQFFLLSTGAQHPQTQQGTSSLPSAPLVAACSSENVTYSWNSSPPSQFFLIICPLFQPDGAAFPFTFFMSI